MIQIENTQASTISPKSSDNDVKSLNSEDNVKHAAEAIEKNSTQCKICKEKILKSHKKEHLASWRDTQRILEVIEKDSEEELTLVLDHGVDVDLRIGPDNQSKFLTQIIYLFISYLGLLHLCASNNSNDCLLLLISRGADTDPVDDNGLTPLLLAIDKDMEKTALSLIELGAHVDCKYYRIYLFYL